MALLEPLHYNDLAAKRNMNKADDAICTLIEDIREAADKYYGSEQAHGNQCIFGIECTDLMRAAQDNPLLNKHAFLGQATLLVIALFFVELVNVVKQTTPWNESRFFDARPVMVKQLEETLDEMMTLDDLQSETLSESPLASPR